MTDVLERQQAVVKAARRAGNKMMKIAGIIGNLGDDFVEPAIKIRAEAALLLDTLNAHDAPPEGEG